MSQVPEKVPEKHIIFFLLRFHIHIENIMNFQFNLAFSPAILFVCLLVAVHIKS